MLTKKIQLWENNPYSKLFTYILDEKLAVDCKKKRPAIIICPGGSYLFTSPREGEPVAMRFASKGYHTFVLHYGTYFKEKMTDLNHPPEINKDVRYPDHVIDLMESIRIIKKYADEWYIDTENIFTLGFSAGAHVVAALSERWDDESLLEKLQKKQESSTISKLQKEQKQKLADASSMQKEQGQKLVDASSLQKEQGQKSEETSGVQEQQKNLTIFHQNMFKPTGTLLCYPLLELRKLIHDVGESDDPLRQAQQVQIPLGLKGKEKLDETDFQQLNLIDQVRENMPPTFLWHTYNDGTTNPQHTAQFVCELMKNNVPCEFHLFANGQHGMSLGDETSATKSRHINKECAIWPELADNWMKLLMRKNKKTEEQN